MSGPDDHDDAALHQRACEIMASAIEVPVADRDDYLADQCGGDAGLEERVRRLLAHHSADSYLRPLVDSRGMEAAGATDGAAPDDARPAIPGAHALPAAAIGPFRLLRELGRGSMGVVFEAEQELPHRRVALKLLQPGWRELIGTSRFRRETEALGRLRHPGIAMILDAGVAESAAGAMPWIAMELVPGRRLDDFVRAHRLDRTRRLRLLIQACEAVDHAHRHGVVHRDLKPANLLVEPGESGGDEGARVRVVDFGIALIADREDAAVDPMTRATTLGDLLGTLAYMSPEQAAGDTAKVGARSDVYSLGVIAYELLAGRPPHATGELPIAAALRAITETDPVALSRLDPGLRGDLENVVARAIEKDPARRYPSAGEFAADLARYLDHRPVLARPPTPFERAAKFARRNRALVTGSAVAAVAIAGGIAALAVGLSKATRAFATSEGRRRAANHLVLSQMERVEKLGDVSGSRLAREQMIEDVRRFVAEQGIEADARAGDPTAMDALARFLEGESDLHVRSREFDRAERLLGDALALRGRLRELDPDDPGWQEAWSIVQVKVGDVLKERSRYEAAQAHYLASLAIDEALVARFPADQHFLDNLAYSYCRIGDLEQTLCRDRAALGWFDRWLATCEELARRQPASRAALLNLARAHQTLSGATGGLGDLPAAAEHADAAIRTLDPLFVAEQGDLEAGFVLANALVTRAILPFDGANLDGPERLAARAGAILERLAAENPDRPELERGRRMIGMLLARNAARRGDLPAARAALERSVALLVEFADTRPEATDLDQYNAAHALLVLESVSRKEPAPADADSESERRRAAGIARLEALVAAENPHWEALTRLADSLLSPESGTHRDVERGLALVRRALVRRPDRAAGHFVDLAEGLRSAGDSATVRRIADLVAELHPDCPRALAARLATLRGE